MGDDTFYFTVRHAHSDFQYLQRGGALDERVRYHTKIYGFQYPISSDSDTSEVFAAYAKEVPLTHIATITAPPDGTVARFLMAPARHAGLQSSLTSSYEGRVFARATPQPSPP